MVLKLIVFPDVLKRLQLLLLAPVLALLQVPLQLDLVKSGLGFCPICPKTLHNTSWSFVADRACQLDIRAQWEVWREVSPQREVPAD